MWIRIFFIFFMILPLATFGQKELEVKLADEYYRKGELEKARSMYESIAKNHKYIPQIHSNYFELLLDLKEFNDASKYLTNVIKRYPTNLYYVLDRGLLYRETGDKERMNTYYIRLITDDIRYDNYKTRIAAQYFLNNQLTEFTIIAYKEGRNASNDPNAYSLELANIYRYLNRKEEMVGEYLNYLTVNPAYLNQIRNTMQVSLTEREDLESLEAILYSKIQSDPENPTFNELLIWVNLQQKNFSGAFIQARALDRRKGSAGDRAMNIGVIALENKDYVSASQIFTYIISQYPSTNNAVLARHYRIKAEEEMVKRSFPIDENKIRSLINKYQQFIDEIGFERTTLDAYRNKALLHAFFLDEKDSAILILKEVIAHPRAPLTLKSQCKLDLGDIFILEEEPWESALLYSQVEKTMKETSVGYEAKLRNAKLSYYTGNFKLAQEHLDILKEATTREISNDAMKLSLLIRDNTGMDSTEEAMREYASIELMLFQNKIDEAKAAIDQMMLDYSLHSLMDELIWLKASLVLQEGKYDEAIILYAQIQNNYFNDILGDDAYYRMAVIYEENIHDIPKAMEIYEDFMRAYPGSIFTIDARKRYRTLRGDFDHLDEEVKSEEF